MFMFYIRVKESGNITAEGVQLSNKKCFVYWDPEPIDDKPLGIFYDRLDEVKEHIETANADLQLVPVGSTVDSAVAALRLKHEEELYALQDRQRLELDLVLRREREDADATRRLEREDDDASEQRTREDTDIDASNT